MGRVRITRPFVLLALAALLAPRIEASRTGVGESNPPAAVVLAKTDAAGLLAPLAPAAADDVDVVAAELPRFDLGNVVLVESELEREDGFDLGPLDLLGPTPLRGPPPSYPETRVGGFELLSPFRVGASASLSLWSRQACGFSCRGVASDSRYDPWGLCLGELPCPQFLKDQAAYYKKVGTNVAQSLKEAYKPIVDQVVKPTATAATDMAKLAWDRTTGGRKYSKQEGDRIITNYAWTWIGLATTVRGLTGPTPKSVGALAGESAPGARAAARYRAGRCPAGRNGCSSRP